MRNSKYINNSVSNIQEYAKFLGYKVEFRSDSVNFYFKIYKKKWFGLYYELIQDYIGVWDGMVYNFDNVYGDVERFIKEINYVA